MRARRRPVPERGSPGNRIPCGTVRTITAAVLLAGAIALAGYWLFLRDSGDDVAAFFALPTPTVCGAGELAIEATDAHFAAFTEGQAPPRQGDKFLLVSVSVKNRGASTQSMVEGHFRVTDRPGRSYGPTALAGRTARLSGRIAPGETASDVVAFGVPTAVHAAKLVYDDGCTHQEWLVP